MFNPFLLGSVPKAISDVQVPKDERFVQESRLPAGQALPRLPLTLRVGRLLIRMGTKLAHEESTEYQPGHLLN